MKTNFTSLHPWHRLTELLCVGLVFVALPVRADKKHHGGRHHSGHGNYVHHYNSHYSGHSDGHSRKPTIARNYDHYDPNIGYYEGYYNEYPVYSPRYQGRSYYDNSNYGHSHHHSLTTQLLQQLLR